MRRKVAILGGGMAGLTAAWSLSAPDLRDRFEVTVCERGWRLGGKGASSRGVHGRIEEHGLHVWLGYYDNAFRVMREVYGELDRERTDPGCAIAGWRDAFLRAGTVGLEERRGGEWSHWVAHFPCDDREPGEDGDDGPLSIATYVERGVALLLEFARTLRPEPAPQPAGVVLSGDAQRPRRPTASFAGYAAVLRQLEIVATIGIVESLRVAGATLPVSNTLAAGLGARLDQIRSELMETIEHADDARHAAQLADIVLTSLQGALWDGLLEPEPDFARIDHLDFREWLGRHGARPETLCSPLVNGVYDLVFGYEGGDKERPRFAAGVGLLLSWKMFFDYKGALFWKLAAGMGEIVFAPLYEALGARGVRFAFFHRVDRLRLSADRSSVAAIELGRQARPVAGPYGYDPLVRVGGMPCFPATPLYDQLDAGPAADGRRSDPVTLMAGRDFDEVVLAASVGILPEICDELVADSPRWREMVDRLGTVATQALQVWLRRTEQQLGWPYADSTVTGYVPPFDTYAAMSHTLATETWPAGSAPRSVGYFCAVLPDVDARDPAAARERVEASAREFLTRSGGHYWPMAVDAEGHFRWELVVDHGMFCSANVDPSDRYVQSLPGTLRVRLRADGSGYRNLHLAGDWVDTGLNAGCIEAATLAGLQAANSVSGRPPLAGVLGSWCRLGESRAPR